MPRPGSSPRITARLRRWVRSRGRRRYGRPGAPAIPRAQAPRAARSSPEGKSPSSRRNPPLSRRLVPDQRTVASAARPRTKRPNQYAPWPVCSRVGPQRPGQNGQPRRFPTSHGEPKWDVLAGAVLRDEPVASSPFSVRPNSARPSWADAVPSATMTRPYYGRPPLLVPCGPRRRRSQSLIRRLEPGQRSSSPAQTRTRSASA